MIPQRRPAPSGLVSCVQNALEAKQRTGGIRSLPKLINDDETSPR